MANTNEANDQFYEQEPLLSYDDLVAYDIDITEREKALAERRKAFQARLDKAFADQIKFAQIVCALDFKKIQEKDKEEGEDIAPPPDSKRIKYDKEILLQLRQQSLDTEFGLIESVRAELEFLMKKAKQLSGDNIEELNNIDSIIMNCQQRQ